MSIDVSKYKSAKDCPKKIYKILQDQGNLPAGWPFRPDLVHNPDAPPEMANTGTVQVLSTEDLEAELERRRAADSSPAISDNGGIVEEDEVETDDDYESMSNDALRAELADRDLGVSGAKPELIARLRANDAGEDDDEDDED